MQQKLSAKEKYSYSVAGFGQNIIITFTTTFMLVYLYETVGFSTKGIASLTAIITAAKIWDAVNDFFMGAIVDQTRSKWGKLRPYILSAALPIAILTILLFSVPRTIELYKLIYFGVIYILWGMIYTIADVPFWGLSGVITTDSNERVSLIAITRTLQTIALAITTLLTPYLVDWLKLATGSKSAGWTISSILLSSFGMILFLLAFFNTKEKISFEGKHTSLAQTFKAIVNNLPLILILLASALSFGRNIIQVGGAVVASIVFGDEKVFTILGGSLILSLIVSNLLTPFALKFLTKKQLMIYSNLISAFLYCIMFVVGYNNLILFIILLFLSGFFSGFFLVVLTAMIADSVDYYEYKTDTRSEGISFAGLTFISKLMGALATMAFGAVIVAIGYSSNVQITTKIKNGVYFSITLLPAISCLIGTIPLIFYPLTDEKVKQISKELEERRNTSKE